MLKPILEKSIAIKFTQGALEVLLDDDSSEC